MKYYQIDWLHDANEHPFMYLIEVDDLGVEHKKIESYLDGSIALASDEFERGTFLSPRPFSLEDYNYESLQEKISAEEISQDRFYEQWHQALRSLASQPKTIAPSHSRPGAKK